VSAVSQNKTLSETPAKPLDDVMLAMDVVDTLRRNTQLVERELGNDNQDQALLARLHEIYSAQGIEVPDYILREGVQALREDRFTYVPTPPSLSRKLAELYVTRARWGRKILIGFAVLLFCAVGYYATVVFPKAQEERQIQQELSSILPASFESLYARVDAITDESEIEMRAAQMRNDGMDAISRRDIVQARVAHTNLENLTNILQQAYRLRIVSGMNTTSGVWRIPDDNPNVKNYYIIVEPVSMDGAVLSVDVTNEEDNSRVRAEKFGVRVPQETFERIGDDKSDDGIIQNNIIGEKRRGELKIQYLIPVLDGTITRW